MSDIKSLDCDELEEYLKNKGFKPEVRQILKGTTTYLAYCIYEFGHKIHNHVHFITNV